MFSFTRPGAPWFAWEWLWDVIFGWLHLHWGMAAVTLGSLLVLAFTSAIVFRLVHRKCTNVLIAAGVTILAVAGSSMHWLARPHLFTLLFVAIFYSILERSRTGERVVRGPWSVKNSLDTSARRQARVPAPRVVDGRGSACATGLANAKLLWLLPVLTIPWTNLHAGFLAGIILIGCYAAGEADDVAGICRAGTAQGGAPERESLSAERGGLFPGELRQPVLLSPASTHLRVSDGPVPVQVYFRIPDHQLPRAFGQVVPGADDRDGDRGGGLERVPTALRVRFPVVGMAAPGVDGRTEHSDFHVCGGASGGADAERTADQLSAANVARWIKRAIQSWTNLAADVDETDRIGRAHVVSAAVVLLIVAISYAPGRPPKFQAEYDPKHYPAKAADALASADPSWRIFTEDVWAGHDLPFSAPEGLHRRQKRFLWRQVRPEVPGHHERELRLGRVSGAPVEHVSTNRRRPGFDAQVVEGLAGHLRRRHGDRVPAGRRGWQPGFGERRSRRQKRFLCFR